MTMKWSLKKETKSAFEQQINTRIMSEATLPRVAFSAKEVYEQVQNLNKKIPYWTNEN